MADFKLYPDIERYTAKHAISLFKNVVATEKADGSSVRFGLVDGVYRAGGRNVEFNGTKLMDSFGAEKWLNEHDAEGRLRSKYDCTNIIVYGEFYGKGVMKRIDYGNEKYFRVYDVMIDEVFLNPDDVEDVAGNLGFEILPIVYSGYNYLPSLEKVAAELTSVGTPREGNAREGIVVRPTIRLKDKRGKWVIAKVKNPAFEEILPEPKDNPGIPEDVRSKILRYATEERLTHVLTRMREEGIELTIEVTGDVIHRFVADVIKEAEDMTDEEKKSIGKVIPSEAKKLYFAYLKEN